MKEILKHLLPYSLIESLIGNPIFCRHRMKFFDMKWIVDEDADKDYHRRFNGKVFKSAFCECQKCGVQKRKSMMVGKFGKWENFKFTPTSSGVIDVEIYEVGKETKKQKRDRLINEILLK